MATSKKKTETTKKPARNAPANINKKEFEKLVGIGCNEKEIAFFFGYDNDTINRWCKREYKQTFREYYSDFGGLFRNITIRNNQLKLSETSAAMAIFLGKNYLNQKDSFETVDNTPIEKLDGILQGIRDNAERNRKIVSINRKAE